MEPWGNFFCFYYWNGLHYLSNACLCKLLETFEYQDFNPNLKLVIKSLPFISQWWVLCSCGGGCSWGVVWVCNFLPGETLLTEYISKVYIRNPNHCKLKYTHYKPFFLWPKFHPRGIYLCLGIVLSAMHRTRTVSWGLLNRNESFFECFWISESADWAMSTRVRSSSSFLAAGEWPIWAMADASAEVCNFLSRNDKKWKTIVYPVISDARQRAGTRLFWMFGYLPHMVAVTLFRHWFNSI